MLLHILNLILCINSIGVLSLHVRQHRKPSRKNVENHVDGQNESFLTTILRGLPNIVINIDSVNVDQPQEINMEIGNHVGNFNMNNASSAQPGFTVGQ